MEWTTKQDELLALYANLGAEYCADEIARQFGIRRSAAATRRHMYRLGLSCARFDVCDECGRAVRKTDADGLCRSCHVRRLAATQREIADRVEADNAEAAAIREYARQRKRASRLKLMSQEMSHSSSETQKNFTGGE